MYVPREFQVDDQEVLHQLIERFSFAMLVTVADGAPLVSHLPLLLDPTVGPHGFLLGHMARANNQWKTFDGEAEAVAALRGEHGYVSPSWYETQPSVPTWNCLVVPAHGAPRVVDDAAGKREILARLVAKYECGFNSPWPMSLPESYLQSMLAQI